MKFLKTGLTSFLILFSLTIFAQNTMDEIVQENCDCLKNKNFEGKSQDDIGVEFGMCMMTSLSTRQDKMTELGLDLTNQSSLEAFSQKMGIKMATKCPDVLMKIGMMSTETRTTTKTTTTTTAKAEVVQVMEGTIKAIEGEEFSIVVIKDEQGRDQKFLWLRYFTGSEQLTSDMKSVIGKKVKVKFASIEVYSPKAKEYFDRKELKGIEFK